MDHRSLILLASVIAFAVAGTSGRAEDGVTKDRIVFGQVAALEGPAQALGQGMRQGLLAAFAEVNRAGGVAGRKLELKSADDECRPADRDRGQSSFHRPFYRRRVPTQSV